MRGTGTASTIAELSEFASFLPSEQRFICQSLDLGLGRSDALALWSRNAAEAALMRAQALLYRELDSLRATLSIASEVHDPKKFLGRLIALATFDLAQERISSFPAFRFLYERLLGPEVRPFLPAAFCAAATLPHIRPDWRMRLVRSISETALTAPGWTLEMPTFYPEWVEKEPL